MCYCHVGIRYLQLKHAGYDNAKVYDRSRVDWAHFGNRLR